MFTLTDASGNPVELRDGVFIVQDLATYELEGTDPLPPLLPYVRPLHANGGRIAEVCFENFVGCAQVGPLRFEVRHSKLSDAGFSAMRDTVVERMAELVFGFQSPTGFNVAVDPPASSASVPFHALAYLRHVMLGVEGGESLQGQFLEVARHPHRKVETEPGWIPVSHVSRVSPAALTAIASNPERLQRISPGHALVQTSLGRMLAKRGAPRFPSELLSTRREETFDTHENRLVKAFLREARELVARFDSVRLTNPVLREDLVQMRGELEQMAGHDFLSEVGELTVFPSDSTVLQRRAGYKELFQHWLALRAGTALKDDDLWKRLLDAKDCAALYELWSFFAVRELLDELLGPASRVEVELTEVQAKVPWGAKVVWPNGVTLSFNRTYQGTKAGSLREKGDTSYSVQFRPDLVIHVPRGDKKFAALVLDAKFKFSGTKLTELEALEENAPAESEDAVAAEKAEAVRKAVIGDLHKMHAYKDALRDVEGAFVVFPGNEFVKHLFDANSKDWQGVGAFSLVPGAEAEKLKDLLTKFCASKAP